MGSTMPLCRSGTGWVHPVPDRVKPSFVIFDIRAALWRSGLSARMSKITNDGLTRSGTGCFIAIPIWQQWASKNQWSRTDACLTDDESICTIGTKSSRTDSQLPRRLTSSLVSHPRQLLSSSARSLISLCSRAVRIWTLLTYWQETTASGKGNDGIQLGLRTVIMRSNDRRTPATRSPV